MAPIEFSTLLCWMLFVPNRGPYLNLLSIPDPLARSSWPAQLQALKDKFLEPVFWQVKTPTDIQNLLLSNEFPYEWKVGHPVLRVAQILALAKVAGADIKDVLQKIAFFKDVIAAKMQNSKSVDDMIHNLCSHIIR